MKQDCGEESRTGRIQYLFLELPNCTRALTPEATVIDNFCYALHNMARLEDRPAGMEAEIFSLLFDSAEIVNFTPEDKAKYEHEMRTERDFHNQLAYAREKGIEDGLKQGREEGKEQGIRDTQLETARRMLALSMDLTTIVQVTGLPEEEVRSLAAAPSPSA